TLPYDIFVKAKSDAWISVLITGIIIQIFIFIYGCLLRRFPNYSLFDIAIHLLGNFVGKIFIVIFVLSYISVAKLIMARFSFYFKFYSHFYRHRKHSSNRPFYSIDVRCIYRFFYSKCLRIKIYSYYPYLTYWFKWDYIDYKRNCASYIFFSRV